MWETHMSGSMALARIVGVPCGQNFDPCGNCRLPTAGGTLLKIGDIEQPAPLT
jgi:hypothetical protein